PAGYRGRLGEGERWGRDRAAHGAAPDSLQRPLLRRSRFRQQVSPSVRQPSTENFRRRRFGACYVSGPVADWGRFTKRCKSEVGSPRGSNPKELLLSTICTRRGGVMAGIPTKFVIADRVFDAVRAAAGPFADFLNDPQSRPYAYLGVIGAA